MKIHVASKAAQKTGAVTDACQALGINAEIIGLSASSGIDEQPFGLSMTTRGAENRLNAIMGTSADLFVSMENGIETSGPDHYFDFAVILVSDGTKTVYVQSMAIEFPFEAVHEARRRGFDKVTVGKVLAELGMVRDHQDPHAELTSGAFPRRKILALAVQMALAQFALTK